MLVKCTRCEERKTDDLFYKNKSRPNGLTSWCKQCTAAYQAALPKKTRAQYAATYYNKRKETNPALFMWKQAKHRAEFDYNGMEFSIDVEDIIIPEKCPYFDIPFIPLDRNWGYSLDRIDSSKGYVKGNIQVISSKANTMKNNATKEELIKFAEGVLYLHAQEVWTRAR